MSDRDTYFDDHIVVHSLHSPNNNIMIRSRGGGGPSGTLNGSSSPITSSSSSSSKKGFEKFTVHGVLPSGKRLRLSLSHCLVLIAGLFLITYRNIIGLLSSSSSHADLSWIHNYYFQPAAADHGINDPRPVFVIHIGPWKTGTTFLQSTLCEPKADAVIASDHYYYLGTSMMHFRRNDKIPFSFRGIFEESPGRTNSQPAVNQNFTSILDQMREQNQSGIIIHENLHALPVSFTNELARALADWRVIIVMGYRPIFEWLVSRWNQYAVDSFSLSAWPNETNEDGDPGFPPSARFAPITNTDFDGLTESLRKENTTSVFEKTLKTWRQSFGDVRIIDINNLPSRDDGKDPLLMHFMCNILPSATNICREAPELASFRHSGSGGRLYDQLAAWAWQMKLIDPSLLTKQFVKNNMKKYHARELNSTDLQVVCPSFAELEILRRWTLETDEKVFQNSSRVEQVEASFQRALERNAFCTVDPSILLQDQWAPFFENLQKPRVHIDHA